MNIKKNLDGRNRTITIFLCFLIITYLIPVVFPLEIAPYWQEDGVIESLGAFFFLIASLFLFGAFFRLRKIKLAVHKKFETIWILALGLLFFVAFGEEISWGQRIFNFDTPEALKEINHQKEFNLHNINMVHGLDENGERKTGIAALITSHRLFYALLIGYFIIIPLIMLFSIWPQRLFTVLQMPVAPVWIGCIFFAVFLFEVSPCPNSPHPLYPQLQTDPWQSRKSDEFPSAIADSICGRHLICSGMFRSLLSPNPNCPWLLFLPQLQTHPISSRNKLKE